LWIIGAMAVLEAPVRAQSADSQTPASIERIRAALKQPPGRLQASASSGDIPTFHVEVQGRLPLPPAIEEKPFDPTFGLPSVGELLMGGIGRIQSAVVDYRHNRARRRARTAVDQALAAFCAVRECPTPRTK
jgi:hypothetical protein